MGLGTTYSHYSKMIGMTNIIMCPSHLVEKWKREVETYVPNSKAYIIREIKDLISIEQHIKSPNKKEHSYLILSKENAKFSYELRPAAIWSNSKKAWVCPSCGQILRKKEKVGTGRFARMQEVPLTITDFLGHYSYNSICTNEILKYDKESHKYVKQKCNTNLWVPLNKEDKKTKWIKLGSEGWLYKEHIDKVYNDLIQTPTLNTKQRKLFNKVAEVKQNLEDGLTGFEGLKAPRKYSLSKYIRYKFKNRIDYVILDEIELCLHI